MKYSERDFGIGGWVCIVTENPHVDPNDPDIDMVSGNVVKKNNEGILISCENVLGPNLDTFFPFGIIDEIIAH